MRLSYKLEKIGLCLGSDFLIELIGVSKIYQGRTAALKDVNLKIEKGEFVFIVGPSGAGKSTFIKLLLREEVPTEGEVLVNGVNTTNLKKNEIPFFRRKIGVVFQDFRLLQNRTVFENVAFAMQVIGAHPKDIRRQVPNVLSLVGLGGRMRAFPNQLSGGEQQRVSIARALVNSPSVLIADEPTGNLDPDTSWDIMRLINDINQIGTTVVMATHAKDIVNGMKKRVIAIDGGTIVRDDKKGVYGYEI